MVFLGETLLNGVKPLISVSFNQRFSKLPLLEIIPQCFNVRTAV